jgi:hypothetical protein
MKKIEKAGWLTLGVTGADALAVEETLTERCNLCGRPEEVCDCIPVDCREDLTLDEVTEESDWGWYTPSAPRVL